MIISTIIPTHRGTSISLICQFPVVTQIFFLNNMVFRPFSNQLSIMFALGRQKLRCLSSFILHSLIHKQSSTHQGTKWEIRSTFKRKKKKKKALGKKCWYSMFNFREGGGCFCFLGAIQVEFIATWAFNWFLNIFIASYFNVCRSPDAEVYWHPWRDW